MRSAPSRCAAASQGLEGGAGVERGEGVAGGQEGPAVRRGGDGRAVVDALNQAVAGLDRKRGVLREPRGGGRCRNAGEGWRNHCVLLAVVWFGSRIEARATPTA